MIGESEKMKITLKDGSVRNYESPISVIEIAKELSEGLARVQGCLGYDYDASDKSIHVNKEEAEIVKLIFQNVY